tara:strand:+ start:633 stop:1502 length:870 start_codon:yes stop_codon:yes gene_type:complete
MTKYILIFITISLVLSSCKEDITASWLKIDKIDLITNTTTEGINTSGISDAWVYMDSQPLGVFELPCEIPILDEGEHEFVIFAGIKSNGINSTRIRYPFYKPSEFTLSLTKGETVSYTPSVTYKSELEFVAREDFEDTGIILAPRDQYDTSNIQIISKTNYPDIVQYGNNCGKMTMNSIDSIIQVFTDLQTNIPQGQVFMELDYMNSNTFAFGLITTTLTTITTESPFIQINGQDADDLKWKKIYLDLTDYLNYLSNPVSFEYYIVGSLDSGNSNAEVYLDNIKIVHYN